MEIGFPEGAVYQYYGVSRAEYRSFLAEPSLGSALSRLDKVHRYRRVH